MTTPCSIPLPELTGCPIGRQVSPNGAGVPNPNDVPVPTLPATTVVVVPAVRIDGPTTTATYQIGTPPVPVGGLPNTGFDATFVWIAVAFIALGHLARRSTSRRRS